MVDEQTLGIRAQQVLHDKKWQKFLPRAGVFRYLPFVEFAFAAGSLAMGNVREDSDFDVIVGVRRGRMFTARFFAVAFFGLPGWRRKKLSHDRSARDKICLNHFVTEKSYRLAPPYNEYWRDLYRSLVPIFGSREVILKFWRANADWMGDAPAYADDLRHRYRANAWPARLLETMLSGRLGDRLEHWFKRLQIHLIERGLPRHAASYKPRIRFGDDELEFHPDTKRTELYNPVGS